MDIHNSAHLNLRTGHVLNRPQATRPPRGPPAMAEELNTLLKGHDFALCCQDSRCPTGRVRWLGFNVGLGKVGVAAVKWDKTSTGKTFVVAAGLLRNDKPTDERVARALTSLQELVKKRSKFDDEDDGCDYTPNYDAATRI